MSYKFLFPCIAALLPYNHFAQETVLDTVRIPDLQLNSAKKTQTVYRIPANDFAKNSTSLSELLQFQTPVFIKENGLGMVSSPSFRGTTAQQTAFVWNGLNINSVFLGQADVNNLGLMSYDHVEVKSGGGSVVYGSGAIGGSVHLNNSLNYNNGFGTKIFLEGASFGTVRSSVKTTFSDRRLSFSFSGNFIQSANDYAIPEKYYTNLNGKYRNIAVNTGIGYRLDAKNELFWHTQFYDGLQHYPISSEMATKTKYETDNVRSLLGWNVFSPKVKNQFSAAYLEENFSYFGDILKSKSSGGRGQVYVLKDDFTYKFSPRFFWNTLAEYRYTEAAGFSSGIKNPERASLALASLVKIQASEHFYVEGGIKKEWVEQLSTPILFSAGLQWKPMDVYTVKFDASKNFRYPTFNDLYWQPGGNLSLRSETSYHADLGNELKLGSLTFSATPFYIRIKDMIQWVPTPAGFWAPKNVHSVRSYGVESQISWHNTWGSHHLRFTGGHVYTDSRNLQTKNQLMYVPKHKLFGTAGYQYRGLDAYLQPLFNGKTYTTSDESESAALRPYFVLNAGAGLTVFKHYRIGFKILNITNTVYETSAFFPMPLRHYSANLTINF